MTADPGSTPSPEARARGEISRVAGAGVSVVIAAYNAEGCVARAIRSVLAQTVPVRELIVVDDGSRDATAYVVRAFGGSVTLIRQENAGPGAARNRGARCATGELLAFLDADDEFLPGMIADVASALARHTRAGAASGAHFYETAGLRARRPAPGRVLGGSRVGVVPDYFEVARRTSIALVGATVIRRHVFDAVGGFREDIRFGEDIDLWTRIAGRSDWVFVDEPVMVYHHDTSTSATLRTPQREKPTHWAVDEAHLALVVKPELRASYRRFRRDMLLRQARVALHQGCGERALALLSAIESAPPSFEWGATSALAQWPRAAAAMLRVTGFVRRRLTRARQGN
jgi:GT2 family glycosyltransferase